MMKIKKSTLYFAGLILLVGIMAFFLFNEKGNSTNNLINGQQVNGEAQNIVIGMKNLNYYPNTIKVKANQPVEISLDKSVTGCFRSFTIRDFGINKYLATPQDKITFTPTKPGTYKFACGMGMGTGTLIVE